MLCLATSAPPVTYMLYFKRSYCGEIPYPRWTFWSCGWRATAILATPVILSTIYFTPLGVLDAWMFWTGAQARYWPPSLFYDADYFILDGRLWQLRLANKRVP